MYKLPLILVLLLLCVGLIFPQNIHAQSKVVPLASGLSLDDAGKDLRRALDAWETELPAKTALWQTIQLQTGESEAFDRFHHILLRRTDSVSAQILIITESRPEELTLEVGEQTQAGPFEVLLSKTQGQNATLLVRWNQEQQQAARPRSSKEVLIAGFENPDRLEIVTTQPAALTFAEFYLKARNNGSLHESAYAAAINGGTLPSGSSQSGVLNPNQSAPNTRVDAQAIFDQFAESNEPYLPPQALITFRVIKGSTSAFRSLSGAGTYQSNGNTSGDAAVRARTSGRGGEVAIGKPGDRFTYELQALEKNGSVKVESESFVRALVGESARYNFRGPGGEASGSVYTRLAGRGVELSFRQTSGDRSGFGITNSRLIFQNGQTLQVSSNTSSRTTSSSSGAPIIKDIPFIGPGFGSSQSSVEEEQYALYVTVELD
ncbi:MAG: hypothetical protein ACFCU1_07560 [Sumerlaeia bacterium]